MSLVKIFLTFEAGISRLRSLDIFCLRYLTVMIPFFDIISEDIRDFTFDIEVRSSPCLERSFRYLELSGTSFAMISRTRLLLNQNIESNSGGSILYLKCKLLKRTSLVVSSTRFYYFIFKMYCL